MRDGGLKIAGRPDLGHSYPNLSSENRSTIIFFVEHAENACDAGVYCVMIGRQQDIIELHEITFSF
jgi:hypothetical protein